MWRRNNRVNADQQLHTLTELAELPAERLTPAELETIFAAAARPANGEVQMRAAVLLSQLYPALAPGNPAFAQRTHTALLRDLRPCTTLAGRGQSCASAASLESRHARSSPHSTARHVT